MKVQKLGHCCMIIEVNGKRIMTDPGSFTTKQNDEMDIDIILFTHEHGDHLHIESLKKVLQNNPQAKIITNTSVGKLLSAEQIAYEILEHGDSRTEEGIFFEAFGEIHEEVFEEFGRVQNTGYFINNKLFYPGDALTNPGKFVEILALPVVGPWLRVRDIIPYVRELKPTITIPVHDGLLSPHGLEVYHRVIPRILGNETKFVPMNEGSVQEF